MVRILWAGKTRDPLLSDLTQRYVERIRHYAPFRLEEIAAGRGKDTARQEGEKFLSRIPEGATVIALDEGGKQMTSEGFASWLGGLLSGGTPEIAFILGGHEGLAPGVLARAGKKLSLSSMTMTHEMARVLFVEQLYRAFTILRGEKYHHGSTA